MSWTLTFTLPRTISLNLEFIPWLILGYFFWGAALTLIVIKAENDGRSEPHNTGSDWIVFPFIGSFAWPLILYAVRKKSIEELEEGDTE